MLLMLAVAPRTPFRIMATVVAFPTTARCCHVFCVSAPAVLLETTLWPPGLISNPNVFWPLKLKVAERKRGRQGGNWIFKNLRV